MSNQLEATFQIKSWQEEDIDAGEGLARRTQCQIAYSYTGDLVGESALNYLMVYDAEGRAFFVGHERLRVQWEGKEASLVLVHTGHFADNKAHVSATTVPGSQSGALIGKTLSIDYQTGHAPEHLVSFTLTDVAD